MFRYLIVAGALALATPALAQDPHGAHAGMTPTAQPAMDHNQHAGHAGMDHSQHGGQPMMDHGGQDGHAGHGDHSNHAGMDHSQHAGHGGGMVTVPADGAMLMGPPAEFSITFPHAMRLTSVVLRAPGLEELRVDVEGNEASATQSVALPTLAPATYAVTWTAQGADGHTMTGDLSFMVH
ncbi:copper resistance CopC family protein [Brevundimonas aveniformis]|uniref:copper resistance CopC family protein n=1 Tax=Brevundimonas aveniformis TaxID=370977 RepID=UPI00248F971C|nr:copper resistance protein CopC [Brevundimonas aveniformis]